MHTLKNKQIQTNTTLGSWLVFRKWDHKMTIKTKAPELKLETNRLQQNVKQPKSDRQQQYQMQNSKNHTNRLHKRQRTAAKACKITKNTTKMCQNERECMLWFFIGWMWGLYVFVPVWPHSFFICQWLLGKEKERKKNALKNRRLTAQLCIQCSICFTVFTWRWKHMSLIRRSPNQIIIKCSFYRKDFF